MKSKRPIAFILAASNHGTMIVNRNDYHRIDKDRAYGVGYQILEGSCFDSTEVELALAILSLRRKYYGDGVFAVDCGANIGVHTIEWARHLYGWGYVHGFEAQERVYYALAGNVALNNCMNASVHHAAVGANIGEILIPVANPLSPASFGSLELRQGGKNEYIGQEVNYSEDAMQSVRLTCLDAFLWPRVDFIKIDVEGMELEVLDGAEKIISRARPVMLIEVIKADRDVINQFLSRRQYVSYGCGINLLCLHVSDPILQNIKETESGFNLQI